MKCPKCGTELPEYGQFCPNCGLKIGRSIQDIEKEKVSQDVYEDNSYKGDKAELINKYKEEIETYRSRRTGMVTGGIILTVVSLVLFIVFTVLFILGVTEATKIDNPGYEAGAITGVSLAYLFLMILFSLAADGGIALIIVGVAVNSTKIKKRENRIEKLRNEL